MKTQFVILTVTPAGEKKRRQYTFHLQKEVKRLTTLCTRLIIVLDNHPIEIIDALTAYIHWGRVTHPSIHEWILQTQLEITPPRKPAKLIFKMSIKSNQHKLVLYPYQGNLIQ